MSKTASQLVQDAHAYAAQVAAFTKIIKPMLVRAQLAGITTANLDTHLHCLEKATTELWREAHDLASDLGVREAA